MYWGGVGGEMSIFTGTDLTPLPFPLPTRGGIPGTGLGCPWSLTCVVHQLRVDLGRLDLAAGLACERGGT